ncbi:MAG: phosphopantothenoylcysteine decarboxylase [Sphingobacterium sp.]|nr:phosphopantothenoylcysteine decarboxylase [Sphingobacterium sp.]
MSFQEKKVLVTASPTFESIDPVRFIGNHSSEGWDSPSPKRLQRASVTLITGPVTREANHPNIKRLDVRTAGHLLPGLHGERPRIGYHHHVGRRG